MQLPPDFGSTPWLESPVRSPAGSILLAGTLRNSRGIGAGGMRILGSHALVLLLRGSGTYRDARGRQTSLRAGDLIHVFPDLPHAYGPGPEERWSEVYVVFEGPVFATLRRYGILSADRPIGRCEKEAAAFEQLRHLFDPVHRTAPGSEQATVGRFLAFLFEITGGNESGSSRPGRDPAMTEAMELLANPQAGQWMRPSAVASRVGLSAETFRKRFSREVGLPPARFQKQKKIERACAVLYQGPPSLKQLASDLGFFDEFHFSKTFKQVVGQPPSAYRRRLAGE